MKNVINIIRLSILAILILTLCACRQDNSGTDMPDSYTHNYVYISIGGVLYRISPYTSTAVPICPDPLCFHNDDSCLFYDISSVRMMGKYMYCFKDGKRENIYWKGFRKLCRYDIESGRMDVLYQPAGASMTNLFATDDYLYLNLGYMDEGLKYTWDICRYTISDGTVKVLTDEPLEKEEYVIEEIEGRIIWFGELNSKEYSTDYDYSDRREESMQRYGTKSMGKYTYTLEKHGYYEGTRSECYTLIGIDNETGERIEMSDKVFSVPIVYGGKLIYAKHGESKYRGLIMPEDSDEPTALYDDSGGKYYICDADGSNERLLCDLEGTGCFIVWHTMIQEGVGDWIVVETFTYTEPDENGFVERGDNAFLLINIVSGEVKVVEVEKRN